MERSCGACTLCCTLLRVDALRKLGGVACAHLAAEGAGCGRYQTRPGICRRYHCLWRGGAAALREGDRPDKLGAVLDLASAGGKPYLAVHEAAPGAYEANPRLRAIAAHFRRAVPVRISNLSDALNPKAPFRLLLPDAEGGGETLIAGDVQTLFKPGCAPVQTRLAWPMRALRRIRNAFGAWRIRGYGDGAGR